MDFSPIDFSSELDNSSTLDETADEEDVDLGLDTFSCPIFVLDFGDMINFWRAMKGDSKQIPTKNEMMYVNK